MTVNEALIVCKILKKHGYGDLELTAECGYTSIGSYPDYLHVPKGYINMEGGKFNGKWNVADKTLIPVCEEIETALLEVEKSKRMTNGDKIRSMTDEELAEMLAPLRMKCEICQIELRPLNCHFEDCKRNALAWLKQEVKTDDER